MSSAVLLVACGGVTSEGPSSPAGGGSAGSENGGAPSSGGRGGSAGVRPSTGGANPSTGGHGGALTDCENPVAQDAPCSEPSAHCGGPCSNSWQVENVCMGGVWKYSSVVPCGPDASRAPQCKNSFSGGALTPCCPAANLDCAGKPDGYPGFGCTPGENSFCSCSCYGEMQTCGC